MISIFFQGKTFNITVIQAHVPASNTEEAEVERFYEDLQDLLELIPKKDFLFITFYYYKIIQFYNLIHNARVIFTIFDIATIFKNSSHSESV